MLSLVIPVFNEEDSLPTLYDEIIAVASANAYEIEIIFVDDGSRDTSWTVIQRLAEKDRRVRGIRFRRNFGKAAALNAGFGEARGDQVITMDADLQDDPAEIPNFLAKIDEGLDVVSGWKKVRHDPWHKVWPSRVFNGMVSRLTGVSLHDHNCGMKCYRNEVLDEVDIYGELHRFVPVLAAARGFRVGELVIQHRARKHGVSKYGVSRFVKGFLDLLTVKFVTGYGQRPQHMLGAIGLAALVLGAALLTLLAAEWTVTRVDNLFASAETAAAAAANDVHLQDRPAVLYAVAMMLLGGQLFSVGIVAELFVAYQTGRYRTFSVAERIRRTDLDEPSFDQPARDDEPSEEQGSSAST